MVRGLVFLSSAFLVVSLLLSAPAVEAADRWAALASNDEANASVAWGDSRDEASHRAVAACKKISNLCGDKAAATPNADDIFTVMCCNRPRHACAIGVETKREVSQAQVQRVFDDAGFSNCRVLKRMSARTGRRID
jgi:hypothetical protein